MPAARCEAAIKDALAVSAPSRKSRGPRPLFAFRLPPVPVQGRHGLRHPGARGNAARHQPSTKSACPVTGEGACCRWRSAGNAARSIWSWSATTRRARLVHAPGKTRTHRRRRRHGFLYVCDERPWPVDPLATAASRLLAASGRRRATRRLREDVPTYLPRDLVAPAGSSPPGDGHEGADSARPPFRFCLRCRVSYEQPAARTSPSWPPRPRRAAARRCTCHRYQRGPQPARGQHDLPTTATQAADLRRQPPGRQLAGRPLQRLRPGQPGPRRALPRGRSPRGDRGTAATTISPGSVPTCSTCRMDEYAQNPGVRFSQRGVPPRAPAGGAGLPALRRPGAGLADHHAQPGADRAAARRLRRPRRARAPTRTCWRRPPPALRDDDPEHRAESPASCSTKCGGRWPSRSTC